MLNNDFFYSKGILSSINKVHLVISNLTEKIDFISNSVYDKGFCVTENFFNKKDVAILLDIFLSHQNLLKQAGTGNNQNFIAKNNIRTDKIKWIERTENADMDKIFFVVIDALILSLNRKCFLGVNDSEFHFSKYENGSFYKRHKDAFGDDDARKISVVLYLNQNLKKGDGGELNIYHNNLITVKPNGGTLVVFESCFEHEVLQSNANRISLTGWLKCTDKVY